MTQRDGFTGGFIAGTIVGSILGGAIGALLATRSAKETTDTEPGRANLSDPNHTRAKRRQIKASLPEQSIEVARRSLEDKIAQLNETIDEVRLTLGQVNGNKFEAKPEKQARSEELS